MNERIKYAFPYRRQDLMPLRKFVRYCNERGVKTSEEQLEFYDELGLLMPVVGIFAEIGIYRKILVTSDAGEDQWLFVFSGDEKTFGYKEIDPLEYYHYAGLSYGSSEQLDYYFAKNLVFYPSELAYSSWNSIVLKADDWEFISDKLPDKATLCYTPYQIFALKNIQRGMSIKIHDRALFRGNDGWIKAGENIRKLFKSFLPKLQGEVLAYIKDFNLYFELLTILDDIVNKSENVYQESIKQGFSEKDAYKDYEHAIQNYGEESRQKIIEVMKQYKVSIPDLRELQNRFFNIGYWQDPAKKWILYLENISPSVLYKSDEYKFSRDSYNIGENIGWCIQILGEKPVTLKNVLAHVDNEKLCPYCHKLFKPKKKGQRSCGKKPCEDRLKNDWKKEQYRRDKLKTNVLLQELNQ